MQDVYNVTCGVMTGGIVFWDMRILRCSQSHNVIPYQKRLKCRRKQRDWVAELMCASGSTLRAHFLMLTKLSLPHHSLHLYTVLSIQRCHPHPVLRLMQSPPPPHTYTSTPTDSSSRLIMFQVFNCSLMDALSFTILTIGDSSSLLVASCIDDRVFAAHLISILLDVSGKQSISVEIVSGKTLFHR